MFGNRQRRRHGFADRFVAAAGGARRPFALADVKRDTEALIAIEFDCFHFPLTNRRRQALLHRDRDFTGTGPLSVGLF